MSAAQARAVLGILLDRVERLSDRSRPPSVRAPADFHSAAERAAFDRILADAERLGAISIVKGRGEAQHLVERVRLKDAARLYEFLGRIPTADQAKAAASQFSELTTPKHLDAIKARDAIINGWLQGERPFSIGFEQPLQAKEFIAALDAVLSRDPMDRRDLRTYSGQVAGNSKLLERYASRIVSFFKQIGQLDPNLSDGEAMTCLGLEKFPQPVLIAGPVRVASTDFSNLVYVGIPPEQASSVEPTRTARSVVTIENLASFNRHVREVRHGDDIAVFTGGFPSRTVTAALIAISRWPGIDRFYHWGDIDEGGLRIALHLSSLLPVPVLPHLMSPTLARLHGTPTKALKKIELSIDHPWQSLATFLASDGAQFLEQEKIDPARIAVDETVAQFHRL